MKLRIALMTAVLFALGAAHAAADSSVARFKTNGYAYALFGDCPDEEIISPGTVCRETFVQLFNESVAIDGGGLAPPKTPWSLFVYQSTLTLVEPGEPPVESDVRWGFTNIESSNVTYDREHLNFASVNDAVVAMSDGREAVLALEWRAISDRYVYGNDGPALDDFGLVRHAVDRCSTLVNQGHQKFRTASAYGTFDGAPVHTYFSFPSGYVSFNQFVSIDVKHGPTCG